MVWKGLEPSSRSSYEGFHKWSYTQIIHFDRMFPYKPSILRGCSLINHPFWGFPILRNLHIPTLVFHPQHDSPVPAMEDTLCLPISLYFPTIGLWLIIIPISWKYWYRIWKCKKNCLTMDLSVKLLHKKTLSFQQYLCTISVMACWNGTRRGKERNKHARARWYPQVIS